MKLLAFDTSTEVMHIALQHGGQVLTHLGAGGAHTSSTLIPAILGLLQQAGLQLNQLDAIAFGRGPGSFTGLRTACAVAQGLAFAAGVKLLPIDTLMALAEEARHSHSQSAVQQPSVVCAALDARMGEVYTAHYVFNSYSCSISLGVSLKTPPNIVLHGPADGIVLAGNIRPACDAQLSAAVLAAPYVACLPTATAMLRLAPQLVAQGGLVDAQDALPLYVRDKVAQTTAEREALSP